MCPSPRCLHLTIGGEIAVAINKYKEKIDDIESHFLKVVGLRCRVRLGCIASKSTAKGYCVSTKDFRFEGQY